MKKNNINTNTKKLLLIAFIFVIIAIIFFMKIKKETVSDNIVSQTKEYEINDETIQKTKELQKDHAKVIIYWQIDDEKSLDILNKFNTYYSKYSSTILFSAVNLVDNPTKASIYLKNNNIDIPFEKKSNIDFEEIDENNLEDIPCYAFINKNGSLLDFTSKDLELDSIEAYLDLLSENY